MKAVLAIFAILGVLSGACLVAWQGFAAVGDALRLAGFPCLAAICAFQLVPLSLCALAWRALFKGKRPDSSSFIWFRWMRDAGGDILGIIPAGGEMIGIRAMTRRGITTTTATASTVVDLTMEMTSQAAFTVLGCVLLLIERPGSHLISWTLAGIATIIFLAGAFALAQRFGLFRLLENLAGRLAVNQGWSHLPDLGGLHDRIHAIYADRPGIARAVSIHFIAWIVGIGEAGIILAFMGVPMGVASLIMLESLTYALRSAAFFVPAAAGVQEGGYILVGAALGLGPEFALALSLMKRARELTLGVTGLVVWQSIEGNSLLRARGKTRR
ncbi:MAG: lysylphosphatidylglycerol synthase domain-containing protein [Stellaceae bacterium]